MAFNPSYLEIVSPVVEALVRARQDAAKTNWVNKSKSQLLFHGDAAFAGQGVVMEDIPNGWFQTRCLTYWWGTVNHSSSTTKWALTTSRQEECRRSTTEVLYLISKNVQAPIFQREW